MKLDQSPSELFGALTKMNSTKQMQKKPIHTKAISTILLHQN